MHIRTRMIAAGAAVVLLTGTAGAAAASTGGAKSPSPPPSVGPASAKPSPPAGKPGQPAKPGDQWLAKLAASLHVSVAKLNTALMDAKTTIGRLQAAPTDPRVVAVVARDLGVSTDSARTVLKEVFADSGQPGSGKPPRAGSGVSEEQMVQALAAALHVSHARATQVLNQLQRIDQSSQNGIDPADPRVHAVAAGLHITTQQLMNALLQAKQSLAGVHGGS